MYVPAGPAQPTNVQGGGAVGLQQNNADAKKTIANIHFAPVNT